MDTDRAINEWAAAWTRVWKLVDGLDDDRAGLTVPACPAWSVRELVAHMVGLVADVADDHEPGDHPGDWTAAQVEARRDRDLAALREEWTELEPRIVAWMQANTTRPLGDVVIHEHDLRGALDQPGAQVTPGLHALRDRMADGFAAQVAERGLDPIALTGDKWSMVSHGTPEQAAVEVRARDFDLVRALMTRRSAEQLRSWTLSGDVTPYLPCFQALGPLPEQDLTDGNPA